jgi:hypothetical protein
LKANFETSFHFIGSRVETRRFQAIGPLNSTCTAPPQHGGHAVEVAHSCAALLLEADALDRASRVGLQIRVFALAQEPHQRLHPAAHQNRVHVVAVQAAFESKGLKPGFHVIDARVETTWVPGAFQLWVRGSQRAPPPPGSGHSSVCRTTAPVSMMAKMTCHHTTDGGVSFPVRGLLLNPNRSSAMHNSS